MSESDRLHAMLNERGISCIINVESIDGSYWGIRWFAGDNISAEWRENGKRHELLAVNITPEQAIAATLGATQDERIAALEALVRDMYRCIAHANEQDWFHFEKDVSGCGLSCTVNGENCGLASLANRMKKLGIEVDYE